jgi:predicted transcriptional regulator
MRLVSPTDFDILAAMADGRRNNAVNLAAMLDRNRSYINTRLPILLDYGLVERVGPAPNSGLYEITPKGRAVVEHRDRYDDTDVDFNALVAKTVAQNQHRT